MSTDNYLKIAIWCWIIGAFLIGFSIGHFVGRINAY
jgi:hypothetical protein